MSKAKMSAYFALFDHQVIVRDAFQPDQLPIASAIITIGRRFAKRVH